MRVIFMGTAAFACPTLQQLLVSPHEIVAVVTQPDRPRGRGQHTEASPVKTLAVAQHVPVVQPRSLRPTTVLETLASYQPDVIVVVAYGNMLPPAVLTLPRYGCLNLHASLLPKYRGAAPINWAIIQGETLTGYTIMQMDEHLDTGPMLWRETCPIAVDEDAASLTSRLAEAGGHGMLHVLEALAAGTLRAQAQPEAGASYAPKLTRALGRVDWQASARTIHDLVRGLVPWPGATALWQGTAVKLWRTRVDELSSTGTPGTITAITAEGCRVACGTQQLLVQELQPANRRRMLAQAFVQGYRVRVGDRFDQDHDAPDRAADSPPDPAHA